MKYWTLGATLLGLVVARKFLWPTSAVPTTDLHFDPHWQGPTQAPEAALHLSDVQLERVNGFRRAWAADNIPESLQLAFIANAMVESDIRLGVRSAAGLPDDATGGAWTAFQILQPTVVKMADDLGIPYSDVVPRSEPTGPAITKIAQNQARVAVSTARLLGHQWDSRSPEMSAFDLFTRWAGGPRWSAAAVLAAPGVQLVLKGKLPSAAQTPAASAALRAGGLLISAGALRKLTFFRDMRARQGLT